MNFPAIFYRVGGTENFEWRRTLAYESIERAENALSGVRRQGYTAFVAPNDTPIPTTFDGPYAAEIERDQIEVAHCFYCGASMSERRAAESGYYCSVVCAINAEGE